MPRLFMPEEYVLHSLSSHPSLFSDKTFEKVALHVYDQLFNVIGNGLNDKEAVIEELTFVEFDQDQAKRFITDEALYYGYQEAEEWLGKITMGKGEPITVLESDKQNHPEIKHWVKSSRHEFTPYPNFQERYSMVYDDFFSELGDEWIKAASWFYDECRKFFDGDHSSYSNAFPKGNNRGSEAVIRDYAESLMKYDSHDAITEAYGVEYTGDIEDFITRRWQQQLSSIYAFLDVTQERLEGMLSKPELR